VTKGVKVGQLIATAPQLLDACQEAIDSLGGCSVISTHIEKAKEVLKAAIKEAKA
jgi:hypothetical protein